MPNVRHTVHCPPISSAAPAELAALLQRHGGDFETCALDPDAVLIFRTERVRGSRRTVSERGRPVSSFPPLAHLVQA
jgi:hypothetical protein